MEMTCTRFLYCWLDQVTRSGAHATVGITQGLGYQEVRHSGYHQVTNIPSILQNKREGRGSLTNMHLSMRGYVLTTNLSGPFNFSVSQ